MNKLNKLLQEKFQDDDFLKEYLRQEVFYKLADVILLRRKALGLTQAQLAKKAGTTQAVISRLENASVKPSLDSVVKIAEALGAVVEIQLVPLDEIKRTVQQTVHRHEE